MQDASSVGTPPPTPSPPTPSTASAGAPAADSTPKTADAKAPSAEEFRAIYAEKMRQATAEAALRRMRRQQQEQQVQTAATGADEAGTTQPMPSTTPIATTVGEPALPSAGSDATTSNATAEADAAAAAAVLRRREMMDRIIVSRALLNAHRQSADTTTTTSGGVVVSPQGAAPVAPTPPPPAPPAQLEAAAVNNNNNGAAADAFFAGMGEVADNNNFFADGQQGVVRPQEPAARRWYEHLGEDFFQNYVLHPMLCCLVMPFPYYVTIIAIILVKVVMKMKGTMRFRVVNRRAPQAAAAQAMRPQGVDDAAGDRPHEQPPIPPHPPRVKRSKRYIVFYMVMKSCVTFFVSMFPLFTTEGLRRELEQDGVIGNDNADNNVAAGPQQPEPQQPVAQ